MTDRAATPAQGVATGECARASIRELAQRLSGAVEVLLLWHSDTERVELSVRNRATGAGFQFEVPPSDAMDAFYHPYAYEAGHESAYRVDGAERMILDG